MTLSELTNHIYTLGYGMPCYINDTKFTSERSLKEVIKKWLPKDIDDYVCQIALPDGKWYVKLSRINTYYDVYVPHNRSEEQRIINSLLKRRGV